MSSIKKHNFTLIKVPYKFLIEGMWTDKYAAATRQFFETNKDRLNEMIENGLYWIEDYSMCIVNYRSIASKLALDSFTHAIIIRRMRAYKNHVAIYVDDVDYENKDLIWDVSTIRLSLPVIDTYGPDKIAFCHFVVNRKINSIIAPNEEAPVLRNDSKNSFESIFESMFGKLK